MSLLVSKLRQEGLAGEWAELSTSINMDSDIETFSVIRHMNTYNTYVCTHMNWRGRAKEVGENAKYILKIFFLISFG